MVLYAHEKLLNSKPLYIRRIHDYRIETNKIFE